jgi:uncharacterized protein YcsI (UPF0317 family)
MGVSAREFETDRSLTTGLAARLACRRGSLRATIAGIAPGYVQGNLAVLPQNLAADFLLARPDYGDPVEVRTDELPVFWACGVSRFSTCETKLTA